MQYDLHLHSTASDGALSPDALIHLCAEKGLKLVALTDHDTLSGIRAARFAAEALGMAFIPGAEFSCLWRRQTLHLLGVGLDIDSPVLQDYLHQLTAIRQQRAEKIASKLIKKGIDASVLVRAQTIAGEVSLCRPHFARALVELGAVRSVKDAFDIYLGQGKVGDVKAEWPDIERVIELIHQAGGRAILAHPTKYNMTFTRLRLLFEELKDWQCDAIEVSYPGLNPDQGRELLRWVKHYGFLLSAGSDFHSPESSWTAPGRFPEIEVNDQHVLSALVPSSQFKALWS